MNMMKNTQDTKPRMILLSMIILIIVMFVLPFFSVESYSLITNTTSHLGAQYAPHAWMMNITFILIGMSCVIESLRYLKTYWVHQILLIIFGLGLVLTGIFQHAPIVEGISYDVFHDQMHSIFASIVGFSFVLLAFSASFIELKRSNALMDALVAIMATLFSIIMATNPNIVGIIQRIMFIMSFSWLHLFLLRRNSVK
jgi:hypothetical membrane protein